MAKVTLDITMSLDGFIAGPNPSLEQPLGDGGDRLHQWIYGLETFRERPPFRQPVFVLTHHPREPLVMQGGTAFTFVTDGIESALEQARAAAAGRNVAVGPDPIDLEVTRVVESPAVTHLKYRIVR
jgi:dihydrofolate reductase